MDWGYTLLVSGIFALFFILVQRTETARRRVTLLFTIIMGLLLRHNAFLKDKHTETLSAFVIGLVVSFLFWLLIGRYNPVGSSEDIQVIGMDD